MEKLRGHEKEKRRKGTVREDPVRLNVLGLWGIAAKTKSKGEGMYRKRRVREGTTDCREKMRRLSEPVSGR